MTVRDYNKEFQDNTHRNYFYNFDSHLRRYMIKAFEPWLISGAALELGCFEGEFTQIFDTIFNDLTVIEAASDLIAIARKKVSPDVNFLCSTFETTELDSRYENIFLIHTLEHLDDRKQVLSRISRWLAPNGRLFVAVPNAHAPSRQIAVKMGLISHNAAITNGELLHGHRITYSLDTLESEVRDAGWKIVHRGGVFFKSLANFQLDRALESGIIDESFMDGCFALGMQYPDLCASIFLVCEYPTHGS